MNDDAINDATWHGGSYEASIILGRSAEKGADRRLLSALSTVCENDSLDFYSDRTLTKRSEQTLSGPKPLRFSFFLHGTLSHKTFGAMPFSLDTVREQEDDDGDDWLNLGIPLGGFSQLCPAAGGWPFGNQVNTRQWREPLEKALAAMVVDLGRVVPLKIACIGFMMSGMFDESIISEGIPTKREFGYVVPQSGSYAYFPTTDWIGRGENMDTFNATTGNSSGV